MKRIPLIIIGILLFSIPAVAGNYTVEGQMDSKLMFAVDRSISLEPGVQSVTLSYLIPDSFESSTFKQDVRNFHLAFSPEPQSRTQKNDTRGARMIVATWQNPPPEINVRMTFDAASLTELKKISTDSPFPLEDVPKDTQDYLKPTRLIQSDDPRIIGIARELTKGAMTEFDAVQHILSWVVDHVRYVTPPKAYDALYTLESGMGNCQNYSHLSAALMRAAGIPVRIVNGITLKKPYNLTTKKSILTLRMGQGRHSWNEVWFPDLGWVPFDPNQTALFVSNRYLRVEVGTDNNETINDGRLRWTKSPGSTGKVRSREGINADFSGDTVKVKAVPERYGPKNLLVCPPITAEFRRVELEESMAEVFPPVIGTTPAPEEPAVEVAVTVPAPAAAEPATAPPPQSVTFGNLLFPEDIDFAFPPAAVTTTDNAQFEQVRDFYVETAEYVSSKLTQYAQVFIVKKPMTLTAIGLALHRFGGQGTLWIDLYRDNDGIPGELIATSDMVDAEALSLKPGYRWQDFPFTREPLTLQPGSYWIGQGYTGDPIINWFFTYGKPVGPLYGTRYKGVYEETWSGAMAYEFNYRITGLASP